MTPKQSSAEQAITGLAQDIIDLNFEDSTAWEAALLKAREIISTAALIIDEIDREAFCPVCPSIRDAWACISDTPFMVNSPEEDAAMDRLEKMGPVEVATMDQQILAEAREIEASRVNACFAPALAMIRPKELSA